MEQQVKKRSSAQSMAKALLIISVCYFHAYFISNPTGFLSFSPIVVFFPCLMGVFFFYAGYNYTQGKRTIKQNMLLKTKQLLIPLVVVAIGATILSGGLQMIYGNATITSVLKGLQYVIVSEGGIELFHYNLAEACYDVVFAVGVLWFLYVLWICFMIFFLIVDWAIKKWYHLVPTLVVLISMTILIGNIFGRKLLYNVQSYPLIIAILLMGAYFKKFHILDRPLETKNQKMWTVILSVLAELTIIGGGLFANYVLHAPNVGALAGGYLNAYLLGYDAIPVFIFAVCGTYALNNLMRLVSKIKPIEFCLTYMGDRSELLYLTHGIYLYYIHTLFFQRDFSIVGKYIIPVYGTLTVIFFILTCLLIDWIKKLINKKKEAKELNN